MSETPPPEGDNDRRRLFDDQSKYLDRFGLLLALIAAVIVIASLVHLPHPSGLVTELGLILLAVVSSLMLLLAVNASGVARRWRRISEIFIGILLVGQVGLGGIALVTQAGDVPSGVRVPPLGALVFATVCFLLVVRRVFYHRQVVTSTVLGAVAGYLLIPIIFFDLFLVLQSISGEPFFTDPEASPEFMYYSLTTITTLGGPLEAASDLGRLFTASASIVGQLYLVVVVALIVGTMASRKSQGSPDSSPDA